MGCSLKTKQNKKTEKNLSPHSNFNFGDKIGIIVINILILFFMW